MSEPLTGTDQADFAELFEAHRRELHVHCYRMTGSLGDAEDLTQETFLRAWRGFDRFEGRSSPRTWLYRIATNACLDFLKSQYRRVRPEGSVEEALEREAWIDPYPDRADPAEEVATGEVTRLYLLAALLHLTPRQRAVFVARDLLGFSAAETAVIVQRSPAAVNSLLQRAHGLLRRLVGDAEALGRSSDADLDEIAGAYLRAHEAGDVGAIMGLLDAEVRISMPPEPVCVGREQARRFYDHLLGELGEWRIVPVRANGCAAVANYLRRDGEKDYKALSIDVLEIRSGRITSMACFLGDATFPAFGLDLVAVS